MAVTDLESLSHGIKPHQACVSVLLLSVPLARKRCGFQCTFSELPGISAAADAEGFNPGIWFWGGGGKKAAISIELVGLSPDFHEAIKQ